MHWIRSSSFPRAKQALAPPSTVTLTLEKGVLKATGSAPFAWARDARRLSRVLPGVDAYQDSDLNLTYDAVLSRIREALNPPESVSLRLEHGVLAVTGSATKQWAANARRLAQLFPAITEFEDKGLQIAPSLGPQPGIDEIKRALDSPETVSFTLQNKKLVAPRLSSVQMGHGRRENCAIHPGSGCL